MTDFIRRDMIGWSDYRVELNGVWQDWKNTWEASESKGYVKRILKEPEYDILGNMTKRPLTKTFYGRVFIVRYYEG
jgi:hypothetical protein